MPAVRNYPIRLPPAKEMDEQPLEPNQPSEARPAGIALFDLDGTLIAWDCQLLFRHYVLRREPWRGIFLPVFLA